MTAMRNDQAASAIHTAMFGVFCLFVMIVAIIFIAAQNNQAPPLTDTYGNTQSGVTNQSQSVMQTVAVEGDSTTIWLLLLGAAIFLALCLTLGMVLMRSAISV